MNWNTGPTTELRQTMDDISSLKKILDLSHLCFYDYLNEILRDVATVERGRRDGRERERQ